MQLRHSTQNAKDLRNQRGASLVEYTLLLALIALVCLGAVQFFGGSVNKSFGRTGSCMSSASAGTACK